MGSFAGHASPGLGFLLIGLWHLFNHIKAYSINPNSYTSHIWFPTSFLRHLEPLFIMLSCSISIALELVIVPARTFDADWSIPSGNLRNFEHALISFSLFTYAAFAIVLDYTRPRGWEGHTHLLAAAAFCQELLVFYFHSADHAGVEGQYHFLFQTLVVVSLATTLKGITFSTSFLVSFIRSVSAFFQGLWLVVMGYMLWTPKMVPKGCGLDMEGGHLTVSCASHGALSRAKSLVNILFGWCLIWVAAGSVVLFLVLHRKYEKRVEYYRCLDDAGGVHDDDDADQEQHHQRFVEMGKVGLPLMKVDR
ncbi:hypothetical protein ACLOJK_034745 [Asimina triloba]